MTFVLLCHFAWSGGIPPELGTSSLLAMLAVLDVGTQA